MSVAALAQAAGVVNVADRLVFDLVAMVFLGLGAFLCCRLDACMVEVLLEQTPLARLDFVRRFGAELAVRVRKVLSIVIWGFTFVTVLRLLGLYGSTGQAAEQLFQWHYTVGKLTLSPSLLVLALFLLYLANSISWFMRSLLEAEVYPRKQMDSGAAHAMSKLLNYSIMLLGFLLAMSVLGLEMQNIAVLGGALSIGVGFGLQNIVNNFISGLILLFERPIKVGDRVVVDNEMGVVKRIGLRSTIIETADYSELIVPNSQFISQKVTNMTLSSTMARLLIPVGAAYGSDIGRVLELLREIGAANTRVATEPPPLSLLIKFGESSLDFELQVWLANITDMIHARSEICHEIARRFAHAGIEIPFPQRDVHLRQAPDVQAV